MIRTLSVYLIAMFFLGPLLACSDCTDVTDQYGIVDGTTQFDYVDSLKSSESGKPELKVKTETIYHLDPLSIVAEYGGLKTSVYVDIYGCRSNECTEANKVVVHNASYTYVEMVLPPDFKISKYGGEIQLDETYKDSKIVYHHFNLEIATAFASLSWNVEIGEQSYEHCPAILNPGW